MGLHFGKARPIRVSRDERYPTKSLSPSSGCRESGITVTGSPPKRSSIRIFTDSVWLPAANTTLSWPMTSGST